MTQDFAPFDLDEGCEGNQVFAPAIARSLLVDAFPPLIFGNWALCDAGHSHNSVNAKCFYLPSVIIQLAMWMVSHIILQKGLHNGDSHVCQVSSVVAMPCRLDCDSADPQVMEFLRWVVGSYEDLAWRAFHEDAAFVMVSVQLQTYEFFDVLIPVFLPEAEKINVIWKWRVGDKEGSQINPNFYANVPWKELS